MPCNEMEMSFRGQPGFFINILISVIMTLITIKNLKQRYMKKRRPSLPGGLIKPMITVIALLLTNLLFAQSVITGTVTDKNGNPLAKATVSVKGKTTGAVTGNNGEYSITASVNDVLVFLLQV